MTLVETLRRRIVVTTWLFMAGLVLSGATAIPLNSELDWLAEWTGAQQLVAGVSTTPALSWAVWLVKIQTTLHEVALKFPFLAYGTDWLAFGHFVIAIAFIGALRDPVRNRWLFDFGLIACALVIPYALTFGALRGIPLWWRLIDCSFGVVGAVPLWLCRQWSSQLELASAGKSPPASAHAAAA